MELFREEPQAFRSRWRLLPYRMIIRGDVFDGATTAVKDVGGI